MNQVGPDLLVVDEQWSDLSQFQPIPDVDFDRLHDYRTGRLRAELRKADAALGIFVDPISLRYAADYACYGLFQSHIPTSYAFVAANGPTVLYNAYDPSCRADEIRRGQHIRMSLTF